MKQQIAKNLIESIAYVEMYVGNIIHTKNFLINALKFDHVATRKDSNLVSYLMKQGNIHFVLTSSLNKDTAIANHLLEYGDSVKKLSFWSHDVTTCFDNGVTHGAKPILTPEIKEGIQMASIEVFNYVEHEFLQIGSSQKIPGFDYDISVMQKNPMIYEIDHIALCHPKHTIENWVKFYQEAYNFSENKNEDIYAEESGMHIIIMKSPSGKVKLPLVEPSSEKSPLHTYLMSNLGAGVHHIAFETDDIINAVQYYEQHGGELRKAGPSYYEEVKQSYPDKLANIDKIAPHGIMLEQDEKGILYQIFTRPVVTRPTLFLEFVQREACEGFGTVNIKALYDTLVA